MKKRKPNHYSDILAVFAELKVLYPSYSMGKHMSTILDEYGDVWGMTDREFLYAVTKYKAQMQMDVPHETGEDELNEIIEDAKNLSVYREDEYNGRWNPLDEEI